MKKLPFNNVRWWNIAVFVLFFMALFVFILPFEYPRLQDGFWGNVISEIWGLIAEAVIAWIVYQRFRHERFNYIVRYSTSNPFFPLREAYYDLYQYCFGTPDVARAALTESTKARFRRNSEEIYRRIDIFGRFFEIEELNDHKICADAAKTLAELDTTLSDRRFMTVFISNLAIVYAKTGIILKYENSREQREKLLATFFEWDEMKS